MTTTVERALPPGRDDVQPVANAPDLLEDPVIRFVDRTFVVWGSPERQQLTAVPATGPGGA
jgi:hypothetical protein